MWKFTADERKKIEEATYEPLSVYGHKESGEGSHKSIREKDEIYKKLFKSEKAQNAGPYARLKAAMDYWCALWFWPIDKADLLPSRQVFFFEMSLILEGDIRAVNVNSSGQIAFKFEEDGSGFKYVNEGDQLALQFKAQYADLGEVCLDDLRKRSERLAIANHIAEEQKFQHWELEFADVFEENGGFDLVLGNPPWRVIDWKMLDVVSDYNPIVIVKSLSKNREEAIVDSLKESSMWYQILIKEFSSIAGMQLFLSSPQNYIELAGMKTDLYKGFIIKGWDLLNKKGYCGYVHPEGVFDDAKSDQIRKKIYTRLKKHYQFHNQEKLFPIGNTRTFSLNIYGEESEIDFETISFLSRPNTIDDCYVNDIHSGKKGIKDENGNWSSAGYKDRIIRVRENELKVFSKVFDNGCAIDECRLPMIYDRQIVDILQKLVMDITTISSIENKISSSVLWVEPGSTSDLILKEEKFVERPEDLILCGPHIGLANPLAKTPRQICDTHKAYDCIDLNVIPKDYLPRNKFSKNVPDDLFIKSIPRMNNGELITNYYRLASRKMIDKNTERTLISAIIPPKVTHMDSIYSICVIDKRLLLKLAAGFYSLPFDFIVKAIGKSNFRFDIAGTLPLLDDKYLNEMYLRVLLLNCITSFYADLWEDCWNNEFKNDNWARKSNLLDNDIFCSLTKKWGIHDRCTSDYMRRELLLELDVLVAMSLGLELNDMILLYEIYFPVLGQYEEETWYDANGRIVFTNNRGLTGVGLSRTEFEQVKDMREGIVNKTVDDDIMPNKASARVINYIAPFRKCDRIADYREAWANLAERQR